MFQIHAPPYSQAFTPLAPRNPNTCPFPSSLSMSTSTAKPTTTSNSKLPPRPHHPPQRRTTPPHHLLNLHPSEQQKQKEQQQTRRREAYLGKVRQKREDRTWEGRSEMILRAEFLERKRAWEEERKREAAEALLPVSVEEEENEGNVGGEEVEMVDRILSQEEEEFEALVEGMLEQNEGREQEQDQGWEKEYEMSDYGSEDDEEWDRFREVVTEDMGVSGGVERGEGGGGERGRGGDGDGGMDMS